MSNAEFNPNALHDNIRQPVTLFDVMADEYRMYRKDTTSSMAHLITYLRHEHEKDERPIFTYLSRFSHSVYDDLDQSNTKLRERLASVMIDGGVLALHGLKTVTHEARWPLFEQLSGKIEPEARIFQSVTNNDTSVTTQRIQQLDRAIVLLPPEQEELLFCIGNHLQLDFAGGEALAMSRGVMHVAAIAKRLPSRVGFSHG